MSDYIGLVFCEKELRQVVSPDYDAQLNDNAWITNTEEKLYMIRIPRKTLPYSGNFITADLVDYISKNTDELLRKYT